jgi:hypothetical protein
MIKELTKKPKGNKNLNKNRLDEYLSNSNKLTLQGEPTNCSTVEKKTQIKTIARSGYYNKPNKENLLIGRNTKSPANKSGDKIKDTSSYINEKTVDTMEQHLKNNNGNTYIKDSLYSFLKESQKNLVRQPSHKTVTLTSKQRAQTPTLNRSQQQVNNTFDFDKIRETTEKSFINNGKY